ncbi:CORD and CS domain protein [Coemansia mojavensis]|nr:CORD and CS domain protein [Coemansia mojavensis]KAJ1741861.1 hypothetical protein LPJ68_002474 [Coemansia sp. RSA 1086]
MQTCTRNGCGQSYEPAANNDMACQYHPGKPVFHEGLKGWTCCKPREHSFDDFLEIKGCQLGPHSSEPKHKDDPFKADLTKYDDVLPEPAAEPAAPPVATAATAAAAAAAAREPEAEIIDEDPAGVKVAAGAKCKRNGCTAAYEDEERSHGAGQCQFHPGRAVFHEGTKGWSCCKPRVTDFDEFMQIKGCQHGRHLFVGTRAPAAAQAQTEKCRRDFYQMANDVIVSVYAKKIHKDRSTVKFGAQAMDVHVEYGDKTYDETIELFAEIDPQASSFEVLSTKIEIKLAKKAPAQWPVLEKDTQ